MARREGSALVWQTTDERLKKAVREAFEIAPLPNPPLELPDFPAIPPADSESLVRQAAGIFAIDRQGFNMRLAEVCEIYLPDHVRRSIDSEEAESEWLASNSENIAERILALQARDWLAVALDETTPDTDRWYLGVSLLEGLALGGTEVARDDCYYLLEAIAYAVTPGNLPYANVTGHHQIAWSPRMTTSDPLPPHPAGVMAATTILDTLSMKPESSLKILPKWLENLSVSLHLCPTLAIPSRVIDGLGRADENSSPYVRAGLQMLSHSPDEATDILVASADHRSLIARRTVAEFLSRIHAQQATLALTLADRLSSDEDESVQTLCASFIGGLARLSEEEFVVRAKSILTKGNQKAVQRLVESGLRDYLSANPTDPHSFLSLAWFTSSEVGQSRVGNMIVEQARVSPEAFQTTCEAVKQTNPESFERLAKWVEMRSPEAYELL
ncbi:MAG: hypothetical protein VYB30_05110 [Candidatus Thermoplasmatota archaeon]|nr:hypothetical protein [Candidatus Thermoplasmatota archaeon]